MPGRLFLETSVADLAAQVGAASDPAEEEGPRLNIAPGQDVRVVTPDRRLVPMRWGLIPMGRKNARGRPVMETIVNARSETVFDKSAFADVARGVVPADGWYEWTGQKGRKTAWRIARRDGAPLYFAAITDRWTGPGGVAVDQVATITCDPNADVRDIHHRMGAILSQSDLSVWLDGATEAAQHLLKPLPNGTLRVEEMDVPPDG